MSADGVTVVSICIPTFNADPRHLDELLSSIRRQQIAGVEIVVSDDGSENVEQIAEVVSRYAGDVICSWNSHLGMVNNWNAAISRASGNYIVVPGQDDILADGALTTLVDLAETYGLDLSLGMEGYIDGEGIRRARPGYGASRAKVFADEPCVLDGHAVLQLGLLYGNVIGDPCVALIRREFLQSLGGFDPEFGHACDLELWMRMAASRAMIGRSPEMVAFRRIHSSNATLSHVKTGMARADRALLHARYSGHLPDNYTWNRSVVRLYVHGLFDVVRGGRAQSLWQNRLRGSAFERARAFVDDCCENVGVRRPYGQRWGGARLR